MVTHLSPCSPTLCHPSALVRVLSCADPGFYMEFTCICWSCLAEGIYDKISICINVFSFKDVFQKEEVTTKLLVRALCRGKWSTGAQLSHAQSFKFNFLLGEERRALILAPGYCYRHICSLQTEQLSNSSRDHRAGISLCKQGMAEKGKQQEENYRQHPENQLPHFLSPSHHAQQWWMQPHCPEWMHGKMEWIRGVNARKKSHPKKTFAINIYIPSLKG